MTPVAKEGEKATFQQGSEQKAKTGQVWLTNQVRDIYDLNLLPTTTAMDYKASGGAEGSANVTLTDALVRGRGLLPTPAAMDGSGGRVSSEMGGTRESGAKRSITLATAVHHALLPTPAACAANDGEGIATWEARRERVKAKGINGNGMGMPLSIAAQKLMPTPRATDGTKGGPNQRGSSGDMMLPSAVQEVRTNWGAYEPAIRRWESVNGPAPAPTEENAKGNHRLSPWLTEWMMGVPKGWICDVDISRNDKLKAAGNGVVPQQAAAAIKDMLTAFERTTP